MRSRRLAFLVLFIFFMFSMSILLSSTSSAGLIQVKGSRILSPAGSDPSYSENMQLYLTSSEAFWRIDMAGGNISVSSVNVPSSVSGYSITLTAYSSWKTQFELFGRYGFGLLGSNEPSPDGAFLQINSTSLTDAEALASSLSQRFALNFTLLSQGASSYLFFSPSNFITEMHVFFWQLVPSSYGGFASLFTEQQFDANTVTPANLLYIGFCIPDLPHT